MLLREVGSQQVVLLLITLLGMSLPVSAETSGGAGSPLTLDQYIRQIQTRNQNYLGSAENQQGAKERIREADLIFSPQLFSNLQMSNDSKLPSLPLFTYQRIDTRNFSLGVNQQFEFGLQAKLFYAVDYTSYVNVPSSGSLSQMSGIPLSFYDARPVIELTMPLLQNGFGRSARANQKLQEAQAKASQFNSESQLKSMLSNAESTYWRLAIAREIVSIQKRALDQAQASYDYAAKKARMNLGQTSDVLQTQAALESRRLQLKTAHDEERSAARSFNSLRNTDVNTVPEKLAPIEWTSIKLVTAPQIRPGVRPDVKAAEAQTHVSQANFKLQAEKDLPSLEVFGSYALNGRGTVLGDTLANAYQADRPTSAVGLRFSMPLNVGAANEARRGALRQEAAADHLYQQKLIEQDYQWSDLVERLTDAQERLKIASTIEQTQKQKLDHEKQLLRQGRSTTFQVLQFEQDYSSAELARAQAGYQILDLQSQMKPYFESDSDLRSSRTHVSFLK